MPVQYLGEMQGYNPLADALRGANAGIQSYMSGQQRKKEEEDKTLEAGINFYLKADPDTQAAMRNLPGWQSLVDKAANNPKFSFLVGEMTEAIPGTAPSEDSEASTGMATTRTIIAPKPKQQQVAFNAQTGTVYFLDEWGKNPTSVQIPNYVPEKQYQLSQPYIKAKDGKYYNVMTAFTINPATGQVEQGGEITLDEVAEKFLFKEIGPDGQTYEVWERPDKTRHTIVGTDSPEIWLARQDLELRKKEAEERALIPIAWRTYKDPETGETIHQGIGPHGDIPGVSYSGKSEAEYVAEKEHEYRLNEIQAQGEAQTKTAKDTQKLELERIAEQGKWQIAAINASAERATSKLGEPKTLAEAQKLGHTLIFDSLKAFDKPMVPESLAPLIGRIAAQFETIGMSPAQAMGEALKLAGQDGLLTRDPEVTQQVLSMIPEKFLSPETLAYLKTLNFKIGKPEGTETTEGNLSPANIGSSIGGVFSKFFGGSYAGNEFVDKKTGVKYTIKSIGGKDYAFDPKTGTYYLLVTKDGKPSIGQQVTVTGKTTKTAAVEGGKNNPPKTISFGGKSLPTQNINGRWYVQADGKWYMLNRSGNQWSVYSSFTVDNPQGSPPRRVKIAGKVYDIDYYKGKWCIIIGGTRREVVPQGEDKWTLGKEVK